MQDNTKTKRKSVAKANGLKSTFKLNKNQYYMTSFGSGNIAVAEKDIINNKVEDINNTFKAEVKTKNTVDVTGNVGKVDVFLPTESHNLLHAKDTIEELYFGRSYQDNIHIQIAYNIMDMKKIFGVYSNNIVYCINNLVDKKAGEDFLGLFYSFNQYESSVVANSVITSNLLPKRNMFVDLGVWYNKNIKSLSKLKNKVFSVESDLRDAPRIVNCLQNDYGFSNYGDIKKASDSFEVIKKIKRANYFSNILCNDNGEFDLKGTYILLTILGTMRQESFHETEKSSTWLYNLDKNLTAEQRTVVNQKLKRKINSVNKSFISNNTKNLNAIFDIYPNEDQKKLIVEYYNFSIRKEFKNMGFSVSNIRQALLENCNEMSFLTEKNYDSIRPKLNTMIDFVIYKYYLSHQNEADEFVKKLRQNISKAEDYKEKLYIAEANRILHCIESSILEKIVPAIRAIQNSSRDNKINNKISKDIIYAASKEFVNSDNISYFAKTMYSISAFLDSKEINMLFDSIINELDNIASFNDVLTSLNMPLEYTENYKFFINAKEEADNLRFIKSIAQMNKTKIAKKTSAEKIKLAQYLDAGHVLGETNDDKIKEAFKIFDDDMPVKAYKKVDHTFRNFIINNVINSNKFNYVMRFINPKAAREIMQSKALVSFALKDIPESQIERYCNSVDIKFDKHNPNYVDMKEQLTNKLLMVKFDAFAKVSNSPENAKEKERLKALVGLYLTILYLVVKSIVRINTSYTIAFGIYERDCQILNKKIGKNRYSLNNAMNITDDFAAGPIINAITDYDKFVKETKLNKRVKRLVDINRGLCTQTTYKIYRNIVAHLNVVSSFPLYLKELRKIDSYFDLYHYVIMMRLYEQHKSKIKKYGKSDVLNDEALKVYELVKKYQTANKCFIYAVNSPFAYNAARYINLSCKDKFEKGYGK